MKKKFEVHDHAFTIDSYILAGSLINDTYEAKKDAQGMYRIFQSDGTGQLATTRTTVTCSVTKSEIITEGKMYTIPKGEFHASTNNAPLVATLILKTDIDVEYKPKVIAPLNYLNNKIEVDRTIDQNRAWNAVDKIIEKIKKTL